MNYYLPKQFLSYWLHCLDEHSLHSPFVYDLYTKVILSPNPSKELLPEIEDLRRDLQVDDTIINTRSYGAGSTINANPARKVKNIADKGVSSKKYSELYFLLGQYFKQKEIWELGTSLGINTLYLSAIPGSSVTTFEGCEETLKIARGNFERFGKSNIRIIEGDLDRTLEFELGKIRSLDMVFFDANHRYEPALKYFEACVEKTHSSSIFIIDDIHWSKEMNSAWKIMREHPLSRITVDLFQCGLVFFDPELPKQNFILKF